MKAITGFPLNLSCYRRCSPSILCVVDQSAWERLRSLLVGEAGNDFVDHSLVDLLADIFEDYSP